MSIQHEIHPQASPILTFSSLSYHIYVYICTQFVYLPQLEDIYRIPKTRAVPETRVIYIKLICFPCYNYMNLFFFYESLLPLPKIHVKCVFLYQQIIRAPSFL